MKQRLGTPVIAVNRRPARVDAGDGHQLRWYAGGRCDAFSLIHTGEFGGGARRLFRDRWSIDDRLRSHGAD